MQQVGVNRNLVLSLSDGAARVAAQCAGYGLAFLDGTPKPSWGAVSRRVAGD